LIDKRNLYIGIALIIASELFFSSMAIFIRLASAYLPNEAIVFFRNLLVIIILMPWIVREGVGQLSTAHFRFHLLRSLAGVGAMYCFFYTIAHIPLAEASLLKMTSSLFVPIIGILWLGETLSVAIVAATIIGFLGVAIILKPGMATFTPIALIGLIGSVFNALAKTSIRRMYATESSLRIVFYFTLISTLVSAIPMSWAWVTPTWQVWGLLSLMAIFGTIAQLLMTQAYLRAPSAQISSFSYVSVIFATWYGWLLWGEWLDMWFFVGALLIIIAGLLITQEHRVKTATNIAPLMSNTNCPQTVKN
jgi:drug/metabolite transporter (DMT)-like permease